MQPAALITSTSTVDPMGSPPTAAIDSTTSVFIEGLGVLYVGGSWFPHITPTTPPTTHPVNTVTGSTKVFVEGRQVARAGDMLSCGATILPAGSSTKVLIGG